MLRWAGAVAGAVLLAGCGGVAASAPPVNAASALLTVDQLVAPDFTADVAAHDIGVDTVAALDGASTTTLEDNGFRAAAQVDYFRADDNIAQLDGPIQVQDTTIAFASDAGAHAVFAGDVSRLDAVTGATAISTGALGDEAHATQRTATIEGVDAVEFTVEWRVGALIDILVVRGRDGGTRLVDALLLAHTQTTTEERTPTPSP